MLNMQEVNSSHFMCKLASHFWNILIDRKKSHITDQKNNLNSIFSLNKTIIWLQKTYNYFMTHSVFYDYLYGIFLYIWKKS